MFDVNEAVRNISQEAPVGVQTDRMSAEERRQFDADCSRAVSIEEFRALCEKRLREIYAC